MNLLGRLLARLDHGNDVRVAAERLACAVERDLSARGVNSDMPAWMRARIMGVKAALLEYRLVCPRRPE